MRNLRLTASLAVVGLLLPALAMAQKTTYDFDKSASFGQYKTYQFEKGTPAGQELIDKRIVDAIKGQLKARGFTETSSNPDVFVLYHIALDKQQDISAYSTGPMYGGYGYGWGGGWGTTTTDVRVRDIVVGSLAIDMVDAKKKQMVWRGLGTKEIDTNAKPDKREKNINKAVEKIMKNYPPKTQS